MTKTLFYLFIFFQTSCSFQEARSSFQGEVKSYRFFHGGAESKEFKNSSTNELLLIGEVEIQNLHMSKNDLEFFFSDLPDFDPSKMSFSDNIIIYSYDKYGNNLEVKMFNWNYIREKSEEISLLIINDLK